MITEQDLIGNDYRKYPHFHNECCKVLFQKTIRDKDNPTVKKYFINVFEWDFRSYSNAPPWAELSYEPKATLFWEDGTSVTLKPHEFRDIQEVEMFFEKMYNMFKCCPDLDNNE